MSSQVTFTPLFKLPFFAGTFAEFQEIIDQKIARRAEKKKPFIIFTPNPEQVVQAKQSAKFLKILREGDLLLPDGGGIVWASKLLTRKGVPQIKERITGVDVVADLLHRHTEEKMLVIGGQGYKKKELNKYPQLRWESGYQKVNAPSPQEESDIEQLLLSEKPSVVFVAFGAPAQEKWVMDHLDLLKKAGVKVVMVVGGSFDVLLGKLQRPGKAWQDMGLEWLYRLIQQPWRWRRQLRLISFVLMVLQQKRKK